MPRRFARISLIILLGSYSAFGQSDPAKPAFDIADVHLSPRSDWVKTPVHAMAGGYLSGDRYELRRATMLDMIRAAWNVEADQIKGGPSWLDYDRFEVAAKTKPGTREETLRAMLQTLLAARFGLAVKLDVRSAPGYALLPGKGELKLKPTSGSGDMMGCRFRNQAASGNVAVHCHAVDLQSFAATLAKSLSDSVGKFRLVDSTNLEGTWDIEFQYPKPRGAAAVAGVGEALGELGLALQPVEIPYPVLTVESVAQQPSPNPPGVDTALPPSPLPRFDVASVRLDNGQSSGSRALLFEPGGRVTATGMPPAILILQAWNRTSLDQVVGLPNSFLGSNTSKNISIVAKAPDGWFPANAEIANGQAQDILYTMLQSLLIDRYQMKFHFEDRPADGLTLVANKPKLAKADPASRTGCAREMHFSPAAIKMVCRNITMAQFAEQMPVFDASILYPVHDNTGLEGAWDFTLNHNLTARWVPGILAGGATLDAATPSGAISFLDAVQKQLGLKVERHKEPQRVLVVDRILENPTEN